MGITEVEHDPRFEGMESRAEHAAELIAILDQRFASRPRSEWIDIFETEGIICNPIQTAVEVTNDPQALANDYFVWFDHPEFGRTKMIGFPWGFSQTPASVRREAPATGQHGEEILLELGYRREDVARLIAQGVVR